MDGGSGDVVGASLCLRFLSDVKTLVSVSEADIRIVALADVTVVQGEPSQFQIEVPAGFEVTGATGASVESSEFESGILTLKVTGQAQRSHQFLISMEKSITATKADAPFLSFKDAQRETGEVLVEVAGEKVKPVEGPDGNRVPLLRAGFRPVDSYTVSFVFMHSGAPFAKKGGSDLSLPKMDVPINLLQWEVFLPERYKVKDFGGDAIAANLLPAASLDVSGAEGIVNGMGEQYFVRSIGMVSLLPGQLGGMIVDPAGAVIANARVTV